MARVILCACERVLKISVLEYGFGLCRTLSKSSNALIVWRLVVRKSVFVILAVGCGGYVGVGIMRKMDQLTRKSVWWLSADIGQFLHS